MVPKYVAAAAQTPLRYREEGEDGTELIEGGGVGSGWMDGRVDGWMQMEIANPPPQISERCTAHSVHKILDWSWRSRRRIVEETRMHLISPPQKETQEMIP